MQKRFLLDENETLDSLIEKCKTLGPELICEWLDHSETLWDAAQPQGKGEYWKRLPSEAWTINFDKTPKEIDRTIRAFGSYGVIIKHRKRKWISNGGMLYAIKIKEILPPTFWKRVFRKVRSILSKSNQKLYHID